MTKQPELIPAGTYEVRVAEAEVRSTTEGHKYINIKFVVNDTSSLAAERAIWFNLFSPSWGKTLSETHQKLYSEHLSAFFTAQQIIGMGLDSAKPEELVPLLLDRVVVAIVTINNRPGVGKSNVIRALRPVGESTQVSEQSTWSTTTHYYRRQMQRWIRESERLRSLYEEGQEKSIAAGNEPFAWQIELTARAIVADQAAARDEAQKYAQALTAELLFQEEEAQ